VVASPSPWLGFDKKRRATAHREMTQSHALSASAHPPMTDGTDASIEARYKSIPVVVYGAAVVASARAYDSPLIRRSVIIVGIRIAGRIMIKKDLG